MLSTLVLVAGLLGGCASQEQDSAKAQADVAADGYVYGYAPIALARTRANMICLLPVNQLYSQAAMSGPETRVVVAPNADTLYSIAWLDLRSGPVLLTHPEMGSGTSISSCSTCTPTCSATSAPGRPGRRRART
nr:DUF1254 domain-containing protein [Rhodococcus sp. MTM3W5.2]